MVATKTFKKKSPLRLARERIGWNQAQLGVWLGWGQSMVSYMEEGRKLTALQRRRVRAFEALAGADVRLGKNITQPCKWWVRGQEGNVKRSAFDVFSHLEGCPACTAFVVKLTR